MRLVFDIETNGFLETLDRVHSLVIKNVDGNKVWSCTEADTNRMPIGPGLQLLEDATEIIGHNIIKFDIPGLQKVYPRFKPKGTVTDTLILSRLIETDIMDRDILQAKRGNFPGKLIGQHGLEAWGYRMGLMKGEYAADFKAMMGDTYVPGMEWLDWCPEMQDYCEQDVEVNHALWTRLTDKEVPERASAMEHKFATILAAMERRGFSFDVEGAQKLYATLVTERLKVARELELAFPPKEVCETFIPKVNNKARGYVKGEPFTKRKLVDFNPSSRAMIADRLQAMGWVPAEFTPTGQPKIDETILSQLPYPEAKVMARHFDVSKLIAQVAEGDQGWLRMERNGAIHGSVNTLGAVTGRCTHSNPNIAQVRKVKSNKAGPVLGEAGGWGWESRSLFRARKGLIMVGADLSGVELRCLAHYMFRYDDGVYAKAVIEGSSKDGTDVHSLNARALGLDPVGVYEIDGNVVTGRDLAKTFIYAFLYGSGDENLGSLIGVTAEEIETYKKTEGRRWAAAVAKHKREKRAYDPRALAQTVKGGLLKDNFLARTPALAKLRDDIAARVKATGKLKALDGRILKVRHAHAALNTLLQSAGALVAKEATNLAYDNLSTRGFMPGRDWALLAHVHDELQTETKEDIAHEVGSIIVSSMEEAGRTLGFRVPIGGEYKVGPTWAHTH
jgi:DNA polymerase I-like protein with 3'-5' exonuclease and polymerase domains